MNRTIISRGILALSFAVVLLAATASSAGAVVTLDPTSVDFGNRQVGTTSPPQAHTLTLRCNTFQGMDLCALSAGGQLVAQEGPEAGFIFYDPEISVTGDFAVTDDCPPPDPEAIASLVTSSATGVSCTITTTFTPTSPGPKEGVLSTGPGPPIHLGPPLPSGPEATLTGDGVTTPTPPTPPEPGPTPELTLDLEAKKQKLREETSRVNFSAEANEDATMAVEGGAKSTESGVRFDEYALVGGEGRKIRVRPKKERRKLEDKLATTGKAKVKVQAEATSESGDTDRDQVTIKLRD
jgi:hypothetical protein